MYKKILCILAMLFVSSKLSAAGPKFNNQTTSAKYIFTVTGGRGKMMSKNGILIAAGSPITINKENLASVWVGDVNYVDNVGSRASDQQLILTAYDLAELNQATFDIIPTDQGLFEVVDHKILQSRKSVPAAPPAPRPEVSAPAGSGSEGDQKASASASSGSTCH